MEENEEEEVDDVDVDSARLSMIARSVLRLSLSFFVELWPFVAHFLLLSV